MKYSVLNTIPALQEAKIHWVDMPTPEGILMVETTFFDVVDVKNPFMAENEGKVDKKLAKQQWLQLYGVLEDWKQSNVIQKLESVKGVKGAEDMVFCANPAFCWKSTDNQAMVLLSNMRFSSRQKEVDFFDSYFKSENIPTVCVPQKYLVEGNGDLIAYPGKRVIWMGHGFRTDVEVADFICEELKADVIPLRLISEHFYHLDTCFCILDEEHVAICKSAFDAESLERIHAVFPKVYEISEQEAKSKFSLNSLIINLKDDNTKAIVPLGSTELQSVLKSLKIDYIEMDTSEFIKSGGSIFCMKMFLYSNV